MAVKVEKISFTLILIFSFFPAPSSALPALIIDAVIFGF